MFGIPGQHVLNVMNSGFYSHADSSLIEECGELIQVLAKYQNRKYTDNFDEYRDKVIEEITHVLVSMNMIAISFGILEKDIKNEVLRKAVRDGFDSSDYEW